MGKSKKLDAKLRLYYKGPALRPTKVATEEDMQTIERAIRECLPKRNESSYRCSWNGQDVDMQVMVGLSSGLRYLKRAQTKALLYDDTASEHLSNLLIQFANKLNIPIVQASGLVRLAPEVGLKTMLVLSLVDASSRQNENIYKDGDARPRLAQSVMESTAFSELTSYLQTTTCQDSDRLKFKQPQTTQVKSSGKSREKKLFRRGEKQSRRLQSIKTEQEARVQD